MKKGLLFSILTCCLILIGCRGGEKSGKDIQKKIDELGWVVNTIDVKGAKRVTLRSGEDISFEITYLLDEKKCTRISYAKNIDQEVYAVFRKRNDTFDTASHLNKETESNCVGYNITEGERDKSFKKENDCAIEDIINLKESIKKRDSVFKDA